MGHALLSQFRVSSPFRLRSDLHIIRKIWHMATGLIGLAIYTKARLSIDTMATTLLIFSACAFLVEYLRIHNEKMNHFIMLFMKPVMRESEKNSVSGMPFYALGVSLSLFFFPEKIAVLSVLFLIFADPIASFCGILYGRDKILPNKSLQGTMAAFTVCYIVTIVYGLIHTGPSMGLLVFSLFAGVIGAVSELCSQFVDDNLCIPVISGLGLFLVNLILSIFKMIIKQKPKIVRKIWGGKRLETMKSLMSSPHEEPIGETLEIAQDSLPYMAKFIDTSDELSIQVHPGDDYAKIHENALGKTECWVILDAAEGAGIYLGLRPGVGRQTLLDALQAKKAIHELLNFYPVKSGDFFFIPAGSIHAIGRNVTLAEVQQNSNITYRVWDWDRLDANGCTRELHVEKSLEVINFEASKNKFDFFQYKENIFFEKGMSELCQHSQFRLDLLNIAVGESYKWESKGLDRSRSLLNLKGKIKLNNDLIDSYEAIIVEGNEVIEVYGLEAGSILLIY